ncbi:MAG: sigma-54-dependent Fis family transcriptional regulator [Candidatus Schekmanbacteria bacterium]|nr:sigma-54-dependent Fis family transcriptional regulator [Candidatus Schekmanbacteria bacterium]
MQDDDERRILIVDDERSMREWLSIFLSKEGYTVDAAASGQEALDKIDVFRPALVIADMRMPGMSGIDLLRELRARRPELVVIIITAFGTDQTAQRVMELGAYDYFTKPFRIDDIQLVIQKAFDKIRLEQENAELRKKLKGPSSFQSIVGRSNRMQQLFHLIQRVADLTSTVLITGESGTGKELVARAIHEAGPRREAPFVAVNCAALPEPLLESELFGHERGAFTGAVTSRPGKFELAKNGTLFLDEIGDMSLTTQAKVLRVLQNKRITRLGGVSELEAAARIVAATNKNLEKMVATGEFREDLFYRLNVIPVHVPALRERPEDIPLLIDHFVQHIGEDIGDKSRYFSREARLILEQWEWPGNVRELSNVVERALVLSPTDEVGVDQLPPVIRRRPAAIPTPAVDFPAAGIDLERALENFERNLLLTALDRAGGVKVEAAKLLQISFRSFRYRLSKLAPEHLPGESP